MSGLEPTITISATTAAVYASFAPLAVFGLLRIVATMFMEDNVGSMRISQSADVTEGTVRLKKIVVIGDAQDWQGGRYARVLMRGRTGQTSGR